MKQEKKEKLKVGDKVWFKAPMNGVIIRTNKKLGCTIQTKDGVEYCYYKDDDVEVEKI